MSEAAPVDLRVRARDLAQVVIIGLGQAGAVVALVLLVRSTVTRMQATPFDSSAMVPIIAGLAAVAIVISLLRTAEFAVSESIGYEFVRQLRMRMYEHLQGMTPRQIAGRSRGGVVLRFTGDLSTIRTWVSRGLARGIVAMIVLMAGLGVTIALNVRVGLALGGVLCLGGAASLRVGTDLQRRTRSMRRRRSLLTSNVVEQISALAVVQTFGRAAGERSRLDRHNTSMTDALKAVAYRRAQLRGIASATALGALVVVIGVGTLELDRERTDVSVIVAAVTAIRYLTGPVRTLGLSHDYWQGAQVSRAKLIDFFASPATALTAPDLDRLRISDGAIAFHDVHVDNALHGVTVDVAGGRILALTGPNGAGKSTLLSLIARFVEPTSGRVTIDGQALDQVTRQSTYRHIGVVSSELPLMSGTLRRNLTYRYRDAPDAELERVMVACRVDEVLETLPNGLDTWLREGGQNLSLGHRQRVALARAILGNPTILLLDEPTSNLDGATKEVFRRVVANHGGTIVVATHDPAEAALADTVALVSRGRIDQVLSGADYRLLRHEEGLHHAGQERW